MAWYIYLIHFVTGLLLANGVPHFVQGVSGDPFPTPFANPPGKGNSSPVVNVAWGFFNFIVAAVLLWYFWPQGEEAAFRWIAIGVGALAISLMLASHFGKVRAGLR